MKKKKKIGKITYCILLFLICIKWLMQFIFKVVKFCFYWIYSTFFETYVKKRRFIRNLIRRKRRKKLRNFWIWLRYTARDYIKFYFYLIFRHKKIRRRYFFSFSLFWGSLKEYLRMYFSIYFIYFMLCLVYRYHKL